MKNNIKNNDNKTLSGKKKYLFKMVVAVLALTAIVAYINGRNINHNEKITPIDANITEIIEK